MAINHIENALRDDFSDLPEINDVPDTVFPQEADPAMVKTFDVIKRGREPYISTDKTIKPFLPNLASHAGRTKAEHKALVRHWRKVGGPRFHSRPEVLGIVSMDALNMTEEDVQETVLTIINRIQKKRKKSTQAPSGDRPSDPFRLDDAYLAYGCQITHQYEHSLEEMYCAST